MGQHLAAPLTPAAPGEAVAFLRRPEAYPGGLATVEAVETHMSWVFLAGARAYKLKKPVHYRHVDFSTLERRRRACEDELRLNRRLAPDVYLAVEPLARDAHGQLALGGPGAMIDWVVVMRRLPAGLMLDRRLAAGAVDAAEVERAARVLAHFYQGLASEPVAPGDYRRSLEAAIRDDAAALRAPRYGLPAARVEGLMRAQLAFLSDHPALVHARADDGRIVEGHGDLRPEHVCLEPRPVVVDCLEFDRALRVVDAASDLAFLALECTRLGAPGIGERFLSIYGAETGDTPPRRLVRFYRARHALTRAKVAIWHLDDAAVDDHDRWRDKARRYLELAEAELPGAAVA